MVSSSSSWVPSRAQVAFLMVSTLLRCPNTAAFSTCPDMSHRVCPHGSGAATLRPFPRSCIETQLRKRPSVQWPLMSSFPIEQGSNDESHNGKTIRPDWACGWMPTWLVTMRPAVQFLVGLGLYVFHLSFLTQHMIAFPFQLIPNEKGYFQSIGLDSLAGMLSLFGCIYLRKSTRKKAKPAIPSLWRGPTRKEAPWQLPSDMYVDETQSTPGPISRLTNFLQKRLLSEETQIAAGTNATSIIGTLLKPFQSSNTKNDWYNMTSPVRPGPKITSVLATTLLIKAYFYTGTFGIFWEDALYAAAGMGFPMTIAMHRSLCVLLGHLTWIVMGALILKLVPQPQPFFGAGYKDGVKQKFKWFSTKWDTQWLWWTMGGYFVSSWLFNIADFINQLVLPAALLEGSPEGVVSQLLNPENNDLAASLVGYIAPCITAPWWEEILYRGFLLPAMCLQVHYCWAVLLSGIVFSAHHLSATGAIPLAVLGWAWAGIYAKSGNLLVTILIHAMWNSRVFLGSWLGL